ncbi:MAG: hypothetical protein J1E57_05355 [Prevotella sp.]|nr:hypothetical protein [Prevotella sp.]
MRGRLQSPPKTMGVMGRMGLMGIMGKTDYKSNVTAMKIEELLRLLLKLASMGIACRLDAHRDGKRWQTKWQALANERASDRDVKKLRK